MKVICKNCRYFIKPKAWKKRNKTYGLCNNPYDFFVVHKNDFCQWWTKREKKP